MKRFFELVFLLFHSVGYPVRSAECGVVGSNPYASNEQIAELAD